MRTIPEEGTRPGAAPGDRLRITFSPDPEFVARLFLRVFTGLTLIDCAAAT
jgi:hypothetical protein